MTTQGEMGRGSEAAPASDREIVLTRIFDAPRALVWRAWTDAEQLMRWWGPEHFTSPACRIDLRVGGSYHFCMRAPDGQDFWSTGVYREIVEPERLVCTDSFADAAGNVVPASHYGMPGDWPEALLVTVTFEDLGDKTRLTLRQAGIPVGEMREMTAAGWNGSFDKLAASLHEQASDFPPKLGSPAQRALAAAGYAHLEQLTTISAGELKQLHGMGPKAIDQLRRALGEKGLSFAGEESSNEKGGPL